MRYKPGCPLKKESEKGRAEEMCQSLGVCLSASCELQALFATSKSEYLNRGGSSADCAEHVQQPMERQNLLFENWARLRVKCLTRPKGLRRLNAPVSLKGDPKPKAMSVVSLKMA